MASRVVHTIIGAGLLVLQSSAACAQASPPETRARSLAATCANCHGTAGESSAGMPRLSGMPSAELKRAMIEYKAGTRTGTVMPQLAKGYTDAQIDAIANWFASRPLR